jgi:BolA protein
MNLNRKKRLENMLNEYFHPDYLSVINESHSHRVPKDAQTHFKLIIVSSLFNNISRIQRHRMVMHLLQSEFAQGLHACSMQLHSPEEWRANPTMIASPPCAH